MDWALLKPKTIDIIEMQACMMLTLKCITILTSRSDCLNLSIKTYGIYRLSILLNNEQENFDCMQASNMKSTELR